MSVERNDFPWPVLIGLLIAFVMLAGVLCALATKW